MLSSVWRMMLSTYSLATRRSWLDFASAAEIISALLALAVRMTSCSSIMARACSSALLRRASASRLALPINSSLAETEPLCAPRRWRTEIRLYFAYNVYGFLALDNALVVAEGTPQASVTMPYRISSSSITSLLLAMRGLPPLFGFFFYIGDDRVRHESLELRAVLGYLPHY